MRLDDVTLLYHLEYSKFKNNNRLLYFFVAEIIEENTNFDSMIFYFGARKSGFYIKL